MFQDEKNVTRWIVWNLPSPYLLPPLIHWN